jgi:hypothetical protein
VTYSITHTDITLALPIPYLSHRLHLIARIAFTYITFTCIVYIACIACIACIAYNRIACNRTTYNQYV